MFLICYSSAISYLCQGYHVHTVYPTLNVLKNVLGCPKKVDFSKISKKQSKTVYNFSEKKLCDVNPKRQGGGA